MNCFRDPKWRACNWVAMLGWSWWDALDEIDTYDEATLQEIEAILRDGDDGPEPGRERIRILTRLGLSGVARGFAVTAGWENDGGVVALDGVDES